MSLRGGARVVGVDLRPVGDREDRAGARVHHDRCRVFRFYRCPPRRARLRRAAGCSRRASASATCRAPPVGFADRHGWPSASLTTRRCLSARRAARCASTRVRPGRLLRSRRCRAPARRERHADIRAASPACRSPLRASAPGPTGPLAPAAIAPGRRSRDVRRLAEHVRLRLPQQRRQRSRRAQRVGDQIRVGRDVLGRF